MGQEARATLVMDELAISSRLIDTKRLIYAKKESRGRRGDSEEMDDNKKDSCRQTTIAELMMDMKRWSAFKALWNHGIEIVVIKPSSLSNRFAFLKARQLQKGVDAGRFRSMEELHDRGLGRRESTSSSQYRSMFYFRNE